jgi:hypothetical protein
MDGRPLVRNASSRQTIDYLRFRRDMPRPANATPTRAQAEDPRGATAIVQLVVLPAPLVVVEVVSVPLEDEPLSLDPLDEPLAPEELLPLELLPVDALPLELLPLLDPDDGATVIVQAVPIQVAP